MKFTYNYFELNKFKNYLKNVYVENIGVYL